MFTHLRGLMGFIWKAMAVRKAKRISIKYIPLSWYSNSTPTTMTCSPVIVCAYVKQTEKKDPTYTVRKTPVVPKFEIKFKQIH